MALDYNAVLYAPIMNIGNRGYKVVSLYIFFPQSTLQFSYKNTLVRQAVKETETERERERASGGTGVVAGKKRKMMGWIFLV